MNRYILLVLFLGVELAAAQSDTLLNRIALEINGRLEGSRLRGSRVMYTVSVSDGKIQLESGDKDSVRRVVLNQVLAQYEDSLSRGGERYHSWIYFDGYSDKVYTAFYKPPVFGEGVFVNFDDIHPSPKGGMRHLLNTIYADFYRQRERLDSLFIGEWFSGLTWLVDTTGAVTPINNSPLDQYLDSALRIRWDPGIYHGRLMNVMVRIGIDRGIALSGKLAGNRWRYDNEPRISKVLPDTYQGKWVRLEEVRNQAGGKTVVSFVFNPATLRMEHPLIHEDGTGDAEQFIGWLSERRWQPDLFYWPDYPCAARSYFCVD